MEKLDPALRAQTDTALLETVDQVLDDEGAQTGTEAASNKTAEPRAPEAEQAQDGAAADNQKTDEMIIDAQPPSG